MSGTTSKKQVSSALNTRRRDYSAVECGEELLEIKETEGDDEELKEVVCLLADKARPLEDQEVLYRKTSRIRSEFDAEGIDRDRCSEAECPPHRVASPSNRCDRDNRDDAIWEHRNATSLEPSESSPEMVTERTKHAKYQSKPRQDEMRGKGHESAKNSGNALDSARQERKNVPAEVSHESNADDQTKYLGPINTDLKDLYCSNYLQHKLEMLKREKSRLEREMKLPEYGRDCFDEPDDGEIAGGVLI